jgi:predicted glycosyltransferase
MMSSLRILMYSNASEGSGHTSRAICIAAALAESLPDCSILILTDLTTIGRFKLAERIDYIHLPVLNGKPHGQYALPGLHLSAENMLKIRRKIVLSAVKTFQPDIVMLDDSMLNFPFEMQKLVVGIAEAAPQARMIWGLSDTLGEPATVRQQWARYEIQPLFEHYADTIWVFGAPQLFDVVREYHLSSNIVRKLTYTGYLAVHNFPSRRVRENLVSLNRQLPLVALTPEGGANDFTMVDAYLRFLENRAAANAIQSLIVTGPGIASPQKHALAQRAQRLPNVIFHRSGKHALDYLRFAEVVICDGGYNTMCAILAHRKKTIVIPSLPLPCVAWRQQRHLRQGGANYHRARLFQKRGLVTMIPPQEYDAAVLEETIVAMLHDRPRFLPRPCYEEIALDGVAKITAQIAQWAGLIPQGGTYQAQPLMAAA